MHLSPESDGISAPRFFGIKIVAGAWIAQLFSMGLCVGAYPVFMDSIETELGASRAQTSLGIPLVMLAAALFSPFIGKLVDQRSPRNIMALGAILMAIGFWLLATVESVLSLTLVWMFVVGLGQAMLGVIPANTVLANWFERRRATMVAVAGTGIAVGFATFPFVAEFLISEGDWRSALRTLSLACLLIPTPIVLYCIIKSPSLLGLNVDGRTETTTEGTADLETSDIAFFSDPRYWLAGLSLACMPCVLMSFNTHIVGWAEELQFGRGFGVTLLSTAAITVALSSLLFGQVCDRLGAINTLRIALLVEIVGWAVMLSAPSQTVFVGGLILFALGAGSFMPCYASLLSQLWPVSAFGRAQGLVGLVIIAGIFVLPPTIGFGYEQYQGYATPMSWVFGVLAAPVVLLTILKRQMSQSCNISPTPTAPAGQTPAE